MVMINGASQYFFLTLRKSQTSLTKSRNGSIKLKYPSQFSPVASLSRSSSCESIQLFAATATYSNGSTTW